MPFVARGHERLGGSSIGNGHCVAYVREVTGAPPTSAWRRGAQVRGSNCAPGTAIATFSKEGRYTNSTEGGSHAAILIAAHSDGLLVWDQWVNKLVGQRIINYRGGKGRAANDGDRFYVIELEGDEEGEVSA